MSRPKRFTLTGDGPSDESLMPVIKWLWQQHRPNETAVGTFAELQECNTGSRALEKKLPVVLDLYPCDVLFVHRDAERESREARVQEIQSALSTCKNPPPAVCLVPVRMSEAWMIFDAKAIRSAAGNPNGKVRLKLPSLAKVEGLPDPKEILADLLRTASEMPAQRLRRFNQSRAARLVTEFIADFSPLRKLEAFHLMEEEFRKLELQS